MKNKLQQGFLIIFEGVDGTGKSTQLQMAGDALTKDGYSVVITREPTNSQYGQKIRSLYENRDGVTREEELQLFLQDRKEHIDTLIQPALDEKKIILCDRYYLSTAAYQGAAGFNPEEILKQNSFAPEPDLALLFEAPLSVSIERITDSRGDKLNDFEQHENLKKVKDIFSSLDLPYIKRINADMPINEINRDVLQHIYKLIT